MLKYMPLARMFSEGAGGGYGVTLRNSFNYLEEPFRFRGLGGVHPAQSPPYLLDCKRTKLSRVV